MSFDKIKEFANTPKEWHALLYSLGGGTMYASLYNNELVRVTVIGTLLAVYGGGEIMSDIREEKHYYGIPLSAQIGLIEASRWALYG